MKKYLIVVFALAVIIALFMGFVYEQREESLGELAELKTPQLGLRPSLKMIVARVKGDPEEVRGEVIDLLNRAYMELRIPENSAVMMCPRVRWTDIYVQKNEMNGEYGIPIPAFVEKIPEVKGNNKHKLEITEWRYGKVGEILHIGPYIDENRAIENLKDHIKKQGYSIAGSLEEEFVKGPGKIFKGDPKKYCTLLRFMITEEK